MSKVNEVEFVDGEFRISSWIPVAVQKHGSEGLAPINYEECPMFKAEGVEGSCVSSSGNSFCSWNGNFSSNVVKCVYGV